MPNVAIAVPETHESILRPVCFSVVRELIEKTGLPAGITISFPGEDNQSKLPGSVMGVNERGESKFKSTDRFSISVNEEYLEQSFLTTAVKRQENVLIFSDEDIGVFMRPSYTPTEVTVTVNYRAEDRASAERWRNDIKTRTSALREELLHELKYHYPIPREFLVILNHLNTLKENKEPYDEELKEWLKRSFTTRVATKVTQAGTKPLLAINEKQVGVIGQFDFTGVPEQPEKESEYPSWNVAFTYKFIYDKPTACEINYPLMVHNQLISSKFRDKKAPYDFDKLHNHWSLSRYSFDEVRGAFKYRSPIAGYPIPYWDDWLPRFVPPFTTTMLRIMLMVDENDPTNILNFNDIGDDYEIKQSLIDFMKEEATWATKPGESVVLVTLFRDDIPLEPEYISMDEDLNVTSTLPLEMRRRYHLRLALVNDMFTLSRSAKDRLRRNGTVCLDILSALNEQLGVDGLLPEPIGNNYIPRKGFEKAAQEIKDKSQPHRSNIEYTRLNVGQFIITATGRED